MRHIEQGSGHHPLGDALYLDLDTVLNEQGSSHRILTGTLHHRPGVVNEKGSLHLTRQMQRVRPRVGLVGCTRVSCT
jgi:hypothetical protein